jgi:hypothetical protein
LVPSDRQLYYHVPGIPGWAKLDSLGRDFIGLNINLAYVILEDSAEPRGGVLVIKSGRYHEPNRFSINRLPDRVHLVRMPDKFDNGVCGTVPVFDEQDISTKSYNDYHDQGLNVPDIKTINAFHLHYAARRNRCRSTNDRTADTALDLRSNLSQFSFDPHVVAHGSPTGIIQVLSWLGITRAYANTQTLEGQRVEMKQYRSSPGKPICVRFNLTIAGPSSFLRVNDLESLSQSGLSYIRSDEQEWSMSR